MVWRVLIWYSVGVYVYVSVHLTCREFVNTQNAPRKPLSKVKDMVGKLYTVEAPLPENQVPSQLVTQCKENNARCARQLLQFSSIPVEGLFLDYFEEAIKKSYLSKVLLCPQFLWQLLQQANMQQNLIFNSNPNIIVNVFLKL